LVDQWGVDQWGVNQWGVNQWGVNQWGVDQWGVDQWGSINGGSINRGGTEKSGNPGKRLRLALGRSSVQAVHKNVWPYILMKYYLYHQRYIKFVDFKLANRQKLLIVDIEIWMSLIALLT
jgi:hypothetical protein